jgi:AAHS family 4-hydroxybenzoate transporter-like MFS transporter
LPESVSFLVARQAPAQRIGAIVERLAPGTTTPDTRYSLGRPSLQGNNAIRIVLSPRYRFGTAMLWVGYFSVLFLVYLLSSWLPTLIKEGGGYTVSEAAIATAVFQIGGPIGSLSIGWAMDRWHKCHVLMGVFLLGAVSVVSLGQITHHYLLLCAFAGVAGFSMNGGSVGMNALAASFYPTEARATGASWMIGIGRIGAILSAFVGGELLAMGWSLSQVFVALVVPALLAASAMFAQGRHDDRTKVPATAAGPLVDPVK